MPQDLIPERAYEGLSENPEEAFLQLLDIMDQNLQDFADQGAVQDDLRLEYVNTLDEIARELGIEFDRVTNAQFSGNFLSLQSRLKALKARIRLKRRKIYSPDIVKLSPGAKQKIGGKIEEIRELVGDSYFDEAKKDRINSILSKLEREVQRDRVSLRKTLTSVALVTGILGGSTATVTGGPKIAQAIADIVQTLGTEAQEEDDKPRLLSPPPKLLAAPDPSAKEETD